MPSELLVARFSEYFIGCILLASLAFVASFFFGLYFTTFWGGSFLVTRCHSCHLLLHKAVLWGTQPWPLLIIIWTPQLQLPPLPALKPSIHRTQGPVCLTCQDKFIPIAWGLPKERRRWRLNLDDWKWMFYKALAIQMWLYFEIFFPPVLDILLVLNCRLTLEIWQSFKWFWKAKCQSKVIVAQKISFLGWYGACFLQVFTDLWIFWPWIHWPS